MVSKSILVPGAETTGGEGVQWPCHKTVQSETTFFYQPQFRCNHLLILVAVISTYFGRFVNLQGSTLTHFGRQSRLLASARRRNVQRGIVGVMTRMRTRRRVAAAGVPPVIAMCAAAARWLIICSGYHNHLFELKCFITWPFHWLCGYDPSHSQSHYCLTDGAAVDWVVFLL